MDAKHFRNVAGKFATGITIITVKTDDQVHGMTVNGFMSVSLEPPLIMVSIGNQQKMLDHLIQSGRFGVSILKEDQENISSHFAGKPDEKLKVDFLDINDTPILQNHLAYFVAKVVNTHKEGDHTLFVGEVEECTAAETQEGPLLFFGGGYRRL